MAYGIIKKLIVPDKSTDYLMQRKDSTEANETPGSSKWAVLAHLGTAVVGSFGSFVQNRVNKH